MQLFSILFILTGMALSGFGCLFVMLGGLELVWPRKEKPIEYQHNDTDGFSYVEYLKRLERAHLDILESIEPIDKSITLWWGLDGLRINEDDSLEWVSRRKPKPEPISPLAQSYVPMPMYEMQQATPADIEALRMQAALANVNIALQNQLQSFIIPGPWYSAAWNTYDSLTRQLDSCCCNNRLTF